MPYHDGRYETEKEHALRRFRERYGRSIKPSEWYDCNLQVRFGTAPLLTGRNEYEVSVRGYRVRARFDRNVVVTFLPPTPEMTEHNQARGWPSRPQYRHFCPHWHGPRRATTETLNAP